MISRLLDSAQVSDGWRLLRLAWKGPALGPGQYLRLRTATLSLVLPIQAHSVTEGWVAGVLPPNLSRLPGRDTDCHVEGPLGEALPIETPTPSLLLGVDTGIGPALALATTLVPAPRLVLLGGTHGLPARLAPSQYLTPTLPSEAIAGVTTLERQGIPSRVAVDDGRPGCFEGDPVELLQRHLAELTPTQRASLSLVAIVPAGRLDRWRDELDGLFAHVSVAELPEA